MQTHKKSNVFVKPSAEGELACTMPRRENACCEETNPKREGYKFQLRVELKRK